MRPPRFYGRDDVHGNVHVRSARVEQESAPVRARFPVGTEVLCRFRTIGGEESFRGRVAASEYSRLHRMVVVTVVDSAGNRRKIDAAHVTVIGGGS